MEERVLLVAAYRDLPAVAGEDIETKYPLMAGQPIDKHHQRELPASFLPDGAAAKSRER